MGQEIATTESRELTIAPTRSLATLADDLASMGIVGREPGVYFGLDEDDYHADPALGSTSIKKLLHQPFDYWWESRLNKLRPKDKDTDAMLVGRAMHALLLEGEDKFHREYLCGPDNSSDDLAPSDKANRTKAAKKVAAEEGRALLKIDDFSRIAIAGHMISKQPSLATAFSNGYPEVSIFWRRDGVMRKCRIDYLKVRGNGDLKSITNQMGKEFVTACKDQIANYRYDMQAAHYLEGRAQLAALVADGAVYGDHDHEWLKRVAAFEKSAFQWIFVAKTGAPLIWSSVVSPGNGILDFARACVDKAVDNYVYYMTEFGPAETWTMVVEPQELTMDAMPRWFGMQGA